MATADTALCATRPDPLSVFAGTSSQVRELMPSGEKEEDSEFVTYWQRIVRSLLPGGLGMQPM